MAVHPAPTPEPSAIRRDLNLLGRVGYQSRSSFDRLAFSIRDLRARSVLVSLMREIGMSVEIDGFGNLIGSLGGSEPALSGVVVGSHLDTVPHGGRFDGTVGIVAGLAIARRAVEESWPARRTFRLAMFVCEESSRFGMATLGSRVAAGTVDPETLLALTDGAGRRLSEIAAPLGIDDASIARARWSPASVHAYLELHIEQGRVLEESGTRLGVVTKIAAPTRARVVIEGRQDHSGATPMHLRVDALCAAAEVILAVEEQASQEPGVVGTVGAVSVDPGAFNVVPGRVELTLDVRSGDAASKARTIEAIRLRMNEIARRRDARVTATTVSDDRPVSLDDRLTALLREVARDHDIDPTMMVSGAGHDAMEIASIAPAGMLFVPSTAGISHSPDEWTDLKDIELGTAVLGDVVRRLVA